MLTKVEIDRRVLPTSGPEDEVEVTTVRSTTKGWKNIKPLTGTVPRRWVRKLLTSNDMLAFWMQSEVGYAIVPVNKEGNLEAEPAKTNQLWAEFEKVYEEHRTRGANNPKTVRQGINYANKLSRQLPGTPMSERRTVLYPKSSDIMRAARMAVRDEIANDTLYHWKAASDDEAAYLVALLNAPALGVVSQDVV